MYICILYVCTYECVYVCLHMRDSDPLYYKFPSFLHLCKKKNPKGNAFCRYFRFTSKIVYTKFEIISKELAPSKLHSESTLKIDIFNDSY